VKTAEVFLACILPAVSLGAFAAPPPYRVAPAPAWVMRAPDSLVTDHSKQLEAGESDFPIVDHQVRVAAATTHYERYVERVLNQEGVESAAQVSIEIDPEREQVLLHQIRVYRGGRFIDKLASSRRTLLNRESELEDGLINGRVTLHVLLKDIRVGDVLDYSYTTERTDPVAERGYYEAFSTQWAAAVRYFRLRVLRPNDRVLHILDHGSVGTPSTTTRDSWTETRWEAHDLPTLSNDSARPAWHFRYPRIEISEFGSWAAVRDWALPMYVVTAPPDAELASLITEVRKEPDEASRILHALRFVQDDIRYTGIEVGAGAWRPSQPAAVLERRYGDCKDKALLLVTVLRALGVQARPALVHSSMGRGVMERQPSPGAFDHVITKVRSQGRDYWLDATVSGQGGRLDSLVQADFGPALVIAPETTDLEQMPPRTGVKPTRDVVETFDFRKGTTKTARFTVRTSYRDEDADDMRVRMRSQTVAQLGQDYLDYYRKSYSGIRSTKPVKFTDDREGNLFTLEESYEIDDPFEKDDDGERTFSFEAYLITEQTRTPDQTVRTSPLARSFPKHVHHEIVAYLPGDWNIDGDGVNVSDPAFEYHSKVRYTGGKLQLDYDLRNTRDHVPVAGLKRFLAKLDKAHDDAFYTLTNADVTATSARSAVVEKPAPFNGASIEMLVTLGMGLAFGLLAVFEIRRMQWRLPDARPGAPVGIAGWLILPLIGVCLSPIVSIYYVWKFFGEIGSAVAFAKLAQNLQYLLMLEFLLICVRLVLSGYCVWAFFGQDRKFPHTFIAMSIVMMATVLVDAIVLQYAAARDGIPAGDQNLVVVLAAGALWIAYMLISQRVRATFVGDDGEDYRSRRVPRELVVPP